MSRKNDVWTIDGREVRVSNLQKIFWPVEQISKGDLLGYYRDIAPVLLPYMQDRPFTMRVWPDGIDGKMFYRWRVPGHAPEWLERFTYHLRDSDKTAEMAVVDDAAELIWVVNQGVVEMHPWMATRQDPDRPTWMVFDLDPGSRVEYQRVLEIGGWIHALLDEVGLVGAPKTTGGDGLHIFVRLAPRYTFEEVRDWLAAFIERLDRLHPDAVTTDKAIAERGGKVLMDYSQNARGKSIAAPYSVRARPGAPVSAPLSWEEVHGGRVRPGEFTIRTIHERLERQGDLFEPVLKQAQELPSLDESG